MTRLLTVCGSAGNSKWTPEADLLEELLLQLVGPPLVRLCVSCQMSNVSTLQQHLHNRNKTHYYKGKQAVNQMLAHFSSICFTQV